MAANPRGVREDHPGHDSRRLRTLCLDGVQDGLVRAPPSTPAGQFAQANASFLGSEVLRCLTPRPNVQKPPTTAHDLRRQQQQRGGPFLESVAVEDSMPVSLYSSAFRLDEFMGGGVIAPPLTGQAVPTFDPRTTGPIAGQRLNSPRRASPPPRTASPRVSAKRHTAEFYKSLF